MGSLTLQPIPWKLRMKAALAKGRKTGVPARLPKPGPLKLFRGTKSQENGRLPDIHIYIYVYMYVHMSICIEIWRLAFPIRNMMSHQLFPLETVACVGKHRQGRQLTI